MLSQLSLKKDIAPALLLRLAEASDFHTTADVLLPTADILFLFPRGLHTKTSALRMPKAWSLIFILSSLMQNR